QPRRTNQRAGGGAEDSDKEEQPRDAKLDQRLEVGVMDGLPHAEGAGGAEMGAGAGVEAGEMKIQVDTRGGAQQLEAVRGECPESHAEHGVIVKAVQRGEREVAAPRAHGGGVEGRLETLKERRPGE